MPAVTTELRGRGARATAATTAVVSASALAAAASATGSATAFLSAAQPQLGARTVAAAAAGQRVQRPWIAARPSGASAALAAVATTVALGARRGLASSSAARGVTSARQRGQRTVSCKAGGATGATPTLHVGIVGYGLVGKELVSQMLGQADALQAELGSRMQLTGVARSSTMALLSAGTDPAGPFGGGAWPSSSEEPVDLKKLGEHLLAAAAASGPGSRALIVDNTASDAPAELYEAWLAAGISVVTPNKKAGSGPYDRYQRIMAAQRTGNSRFLYEATVGAGLPIIGPLQGILAAGDEVTMVQGIFSGTLSYIFNTWKPGMKFSEVVEDAKSKGFTEPDPRDDLSGTDVQRKVTILAREMGIKVELDDVPVKSLVPAKLQDWQPPAGKNLGDAFVEELKPFDGEMDALIKEADAAGEVLRFVGQVDVKAGTASVMLGRFAKDHPFAGTQFADNIVAFDTKWYTPRPLVVQGPGAGASVTAAGVFHNVLEVLKGL